VSPVTSQPDLRQSKAAASPRKPQPAKTIRGILKKYTSWKLVEVENETNLQLLTLRVGFRLAAGPLRRSLERTQTTDFVKNSFLIELRLKTLESTINRLTFTNNYFWHENFTYFLRARFVREAEIAKVCQLTASSKAPSEKKQKETAVC